MQLGIFAFEKRFLDDTRAFHAKRIDFIGNLRNSIVNRPSDDRTLLL